MPAYFCEGLPKIMPNTICTVSKQRNNKQISPKKRYEIEKVTKKNVSARCYQRIGVHTVCWPSTYVLVMYVP